jgi:prepilin-type N-terminal cleavage/methylation domain-containing protein
MHNSCHQHERDRPVRHDSRQLRSSGFTLIELLTVFAIIAILSTLMLGGLGNVSNRGKADSTRNMVGVLSGAILERYESYEDLAGMNALKAADVITLRKRVREELPDSWEDVAPGANIALPANYTVSQAYAAYKSSISPSSAYAGAECLYMIITQSGMFPDFLSNMPSRYVGDIDKDGAFEFWDGWGRPISFIRWAPGAMPAYRTDADKYHDPLDPYNKDPNSFALLPLIFSPGKDETLNDPMSGNSGYGILACAEKGWPDGSLGSAVSGAATVSGTTPHNYNPDGKGLIGAPDPENPDAYRDNISNYDTLFD